MLVGSVLVVSLARYIPSYMHVTFVCISCCGHANCRTRTERTLGLVTLAMYFTRSYRAMGWAGLVGMIVAGADGLVAQQLVGGNEEWKHWGAAPLGLGLSLGVLYYTS